MNIFHRHCDRVKMENIAQMVNVLQVMILTKRDQIELTPIYYVFDLYQYHQGAELLESSINCKEIETEKGRISEITQSAFIDESGFVHITAASLLADQRNRVMIHFKEEQPKDVCVEMLQGDIHDKNTFENPCYVKKVLFEEYKVEKNCMKLELLPCSVICLTCSL